MVAIDASFLYTNIESMRTTLTKAGTPAPLKTIVITFLTLILTLNFVFVLYPNKRMCNGKKYVPTYANLFLREFAEKGIYDLIKEKKKKYLRIIDDIFLVWTASEQEL